LTGTFGDLSRAVRAELQQEHRYRHSVRVARLADRLAQEHGADAGRARLAGMLHDLARLYDAQRLFSECEARALPIDEFERTHPVVLHARLGAELARERFGIEDDCVLQAIRRHTCAAPGMSTLDTILYLADALEPARDFSGRAELEALAFRNLNAAAIAVIESSVTYLQRHGREVAPQTFAALESYKKESALCPT